MEQHKYSAKKVTKAGDYFITNHFLLDDDKLKESIDVFDYWRHTHQGAFIQHLIHIVGANADEAQAIAY